MTLEKKMLPSLLQGFKPAIFRSQVRHSNHWAIPASFFYYFLDAILKSAEYCWITPEWQNMQLLSNMSPHPHPPHTHQSSFTFFLAPTCEILSSLVWWWQRFWKSCMYPWWFSLNFQTCNGSWHSRNRKTTPSDFRNDYRQKEKVLEVVCLSVCPSACHSVHPWKGAVVSVCMSVCLGQFVCLTVKKKKKRC